MFDLTKLQSVDYSNSCLVRLTIDPADIETAWHEAQEHSHPLSRYNAYLNSVCLKPFLNWISEVWAEEDLPPIYVGKRQDLASIWEVINGTAIEIGETRLVLIPSDDGDWEEFCVQQEWVDIPNWNADYYLAVQMNLDGDDGECWMEVLGFATHRQLKHEGKYNAADRTYVLPIQELTKSLVVMDITLGLNLQAEVSPLPILSKVESTQLLHTLGNSAVYSPRLLVPFGEWASFLANDECRQQLYNLRLGIIQEPLVVESQSRLVEWAKTYIQAGWETIDDLIERLGLLDSGLMYAMEGEGYRYGDSSSPKGIPTLLDLLRDRRHKSNQLRAAELLGCVEPGNQEAISALTHLRETTENDALKRQAAVSLGKLDPKNAAAGVRIGKMIELKMELDSDRVVLEITLLPEGSDKTNIFLRVLPVRSKTLPQNLELIILDEDGEVFWEEKAHHFTNRLMYEFRGAIGDNFQVKLACGEVSITEDFTI